MNQTPLVWCLGRALTTWLYTYTHHRGQTALGGQLVSCV